MLHGAEKSRENVYIADYTLYCWTYCFLSHKPAQCAALTAALAAKVLYIFQAVH